MANSIEIEKVLPIYKVENDIVLSRRGDMTVGFEVLLPEIFTLSIGEYEDFHQTWIKAVKVLPKYSCFHKQDWFLEENYEAKFTERSSENFLSRSSERFFHERPFLQHRCYVFLTKNAEGKRISTSALSGLFRRTILPAPLLKEAFLSDFEDKVNQFERILTDSGFATFKRLTGEDLVGNETRAGIIEQYCFLLGDSERCMLKDIALQDEIKIGGHYCQLYTLSDAESLPSLCGARINFDKYSTDKTKCSIGFSSPLGQLLNCNHILNQYVFIDDAAKTIKSLEAKRLRLQSLSAYSRQNAISSDATQEFLNEVLSFETFKF